MSGRGSDSTFTRPAKEFRRFLARTTATPRAYFIILTVTALLLLHFRQSVGNLDSESHGMPSPCLRRRKIRNAAFDQFCAETSISKHRIAGKGASKGDPFAFL
jgi:hypothetical protein